MAVHRFPINVPNLSARAVTAELEIKLVKALKGTGLNLPDGKLRVERAGLALDPCDADLDKVLHVKLPAFGSVTVTAVVVTAPNGKGAAAFHVSDRRNRRVVGGVTITCIEPSPSEPSGQVVPAANPCEVAIAGNPYLIEPDADPSRAVAQALILGREGDFVVPLTNPIAGPIDNVVAYLEHLGGSDAEAVPTIWNIGTLASGQVFFATWRLKGSGGRTGRFEVSVVVESNQRDPTRLRAPLTVAKQGEPISRLNAGDA